MLEACGWSTRRSFVFSVRARGNKLWFILAAHNHGSGVRKRHESSYEFYEQHRNRQQSCKWRLSCNHVVLSEKLNRPPGKTGPLAVRRQSARKRLKERPKSSQSARKRPARRSPILALGPQGPGKKSTAAGRAAGKSQQKTKTENKHRHTQLLVLR